MDTFSEGKLIRLKLKTYGYERGRVPLEFDFKLKCLANVLLGLPENTVVRGYKSAISEVVPKAKEIMEAHFKIYDIPYLSDENFISILEEICGGNIQTVSEGRLDEIIDCINDASNLISPFDLPMELIPEHFFVGQLRKPLTFVDDEEFLKKQPITFSKLLLSDNVTELSPAIAAHEYTHSQLERVKGSCKDYHNREVLPIFMEKFVLLEMDPSGKLLEIDSKVRNRDLFENIAIISGGLDNFSRTKLLESSVYVNSILKANHLFYKYINGDSDVQTNILSKIQDVFDGNSTVEEVLDSCGVTFDNSANVGLVKKFVK